MALNQFITEKYISIGPNTRQSFEARGVFPVL